MEQKLFQMCTGTQKEKKIKHAAVLWPIALLVLTLNSFYWVKTFVKVKKITAFFKKQTIKSCGSKTFPSGPVEGGAVLLQRSQSNSGMEGSSCLQRGKRLRQVMWSSRGPTASSSALRRQTWRQFFLSFLGSFPFCYWFVSFSFSTKQSSLSWLLMFNSWPEGMGSGSQLLGWTCVHWKELRRAEL